MKYLIAYTLLVIILFTALMLVRAMSQMLERPRENVFEQYQQYLPGASIRPIADDCTSYYIPSNTTYSDCKIDPKAFRYLYVVSSGGVITSAGFVPANGFIRLPDAISWWGKWSSFRHKNDWAWVAWDGGRINAYIRHWSGMQSSLAEIYFHGSGE